MEPEHKYISTENIQSMLDENSTLIVEIIQLNNSVKHERGAQLADVQDKLDKKRKKLNRNLMTLAKWADESTEPPVKSAPRPPIQQQAPPAHIPPQYQPVASSGGVTVPLNVPEPIVVAPQSTSPPTAAAVAGGQASPVKPEIKDDPMGTEEESANNDTGASSSEPVKPESEDQDMEAVAEVDPTKDESAEEVPAQDSDAIARGADEVAETPAPTEDDAPMTAPADSVAPEGNDDAAGEEPGDEGATADAPAAAAATPPTAPEAGDDDAQDVTAPATVEEEVIAEAKSIEKEDAAAEEEGVEESAASPARAVDEPSAEVEEPAAEVATAPAAPASEEVAAEPEAVDSRPTEEVGAKDAAADDQPEHVEEAASESKADE